jgi:hypothetical protein
MQQLEIEYFFPLTEQIPLDLDYEPSRLYAKELNRQRCIDGTALLACGTGLVLMSNGTNATWSQRIGDWEIPSEKKQPTKLQKFLMKYCLGWKWMGK